MRNARSRNLQYVNAGLASGALAIFAVAVFTGIWLWVEPQGRDARLDFALFGTPALILGFLLLSGWVLTLLSLVVDSASMIVASVGDLLGLYASMALLLWPGYERLIAEFPIEDLITLSYFVAPIWVLYICVADFARRRCNRAKPATPPSGESEDEAS